MTTEQILFALLRSEICGEPVGQEVKAAIPPEVLEELWVLSDKNGVPHIIGQALVKLGVLGQDEVSLKFQKRPMDAVVYHIRMGHALYSICNALEEQKIPFMPLKGSVVKQWYPEAWMRLSSDIDILVRPEDHKAAVECLMDKCNCSYATQSDHDVSLYFPGKIHVEIHHTLIEDVVSAYQEKVLCGVWDTACLESGFQYKYRMSDAMFRFYHYAHMAKHIKGGGCGIRPLIDLWVMNHRVDMDRTEEAALLAEGRLSAFAAAAEKLSQGWFSGAELDCASDVLGEYILQGGAAGSLENRVKLRQAREGGKLQYVLYRVFMPYENLIKYYPKLRNRKWLLPAYQVMRWFRIVFKGGLGQSAKEITANINTTTKGRISISQMIKELEL